MATAAHQEETTVVPCIIVEGIIEQQEASSSDDGNTTGDEGEWSDQQGEEGEGDDRHLIEGSNWHPVISRVFWEENMLNITHDDWRSVGKGYLSPADIYYLILAAPCFLIFFPSLVMRKCFRAFEERNPWVCNICLLRFRFADDVLDHHVQVHDDQSQENEGGTGAGEGDVNPFPDGNPIVDYYSGYVSQDYDFEVFWCPLCHGLGFHQLTLWCHHTMTEHVRYFSACECRACLASPLRTYHWVDFLHGDEQIMVFEDDGAHMGNYGWDRPVRVTKKCPADPNSCPSRFGSMDDDGQDDLNNLVEHLITEHGW